MESFIGLSGILVPRPAQGFTIKSIATDLSDTTVTNVNVTLSGNLGTHHSFSAITPVIATLVFKLDESITITSSGTLNKVIINYISRGDMRDYMQADPSRIIRNLPGKWNV